MLRSRWSLGLVPLAVLFLAALTIETPKVEADLAGRAAALAQAAGGAVVVAGRDVSLSLPSASEAERVSGAILALPGVRRISGLELAPAAPPAPAAPRVEPPAAAPATPSASVVEQPASAPPALPPTLPLARPFALSIERTAAGLVASGFAPTGEDRDAFMAALQTAAAPGVATGSLVLADGLAPGVDFQGAAQFVAVQASRLVSGRAAFSDDQFSISGETVDTAALAALRAAAGGVLPGGLKLAGLDVQALPPPPPPPSPAPLAPYVFSAERAGNALVLSGATPSAEARALLLDLAGYGGREVVDRTIIASGEPAGFLTFAAHGVSQAARLSPGRFTLTDSAYALVGDAADFEAYSAVRLDLRTAPQGVTLARIDVKPPLLKPFTFGVSREGAAIVLRGAFPDDAARDAAIALARSLFPGLDIRSEALIARGAPSGFGDIARAALTALARMGPGAGSVTFSGGALSLDGAIAGTSDELAAALKGLLPDGVTLDLAA
ncbi:MAG: hypothetical protein K2Y29_00965, partial [Beijerinckiaceae bacterium]|nr:hypothetical protein [Beijerinckiaceae bacterium]